MTKTIPGNSINPVKVIVDGRAGARQAPWETQDVAGLVSRGRAILRGQVDHEDASLWAHRLTRVEDWLELEWPRDDRTVIRDLRRTFENQIADWVEPPAATARRLERLQGPWVGPLLEDGSRTRAESEP